MDEFSTFTVVTGFVIVVIAFCVTLYNIAGAACVA